MVRIALISLVALFAQLDTTRIAVAQEQADRGPRFLYASAVDAPLRDARLAPALRQRVSLQLEHATIERALDTISAQTGLTLIYSRNKLPSRARVTMSAQNLTVVAALTEILLDAGLDVVLSRSGQIALVPREEKITPSLPVAGTIVGRVTDAATGQPVVGADVRVVGTQIAAAANDSGRYVLPNVPAGEQTVTAQRIGYAQRTLSATVPEGDTVALDFALGAAATPLDELVVTGTAFETKVRTVSSPITVITADEIERKQVTSLEDMLRGEIPNVSVMSGGLHDFETSIRVRGRMNPTGDDALKIYIDGIEVSDLTHISTIDPKSIERIEVVRGPQASTIYGSQAASGVLQIFTKRGSPNSRRGRPEVQLSSSVGAIESDYTPEEAEIPLTLDHSVSLSGGGSQMSYAASAGYSTVGEWVKNYGSRLATFAGGLEATGGRLTTRITTRWAHRNYDYPMQPLWAEYPASPQCIYCGDTDAFFNRDYVFTQSTLGIDLSFRATRNWQHNLILGEDRNDASYYQPEPDRFTPADTLTELHQSKNRKRSIRYNTAYNAELGVFSNLRLTFGVDFWAYDREAVTATNLLSAADPVLNSEITQTSLVNDSWWNAGYFGMAELGLREQLFLTFAVRVDDSSAFGSNYGSAVAPRIGASYTRSLGRAQVKLRGGFGKGINPPSALATQGRLISPTFMYLPNPDIAPEEKVGWDAGLEVHWEQGSIAITRYEEEGRNIAGAILIETGPPITAYQLQNLGNVENTGWELEATTNVGPFTARGNYAIHDGRISKALDDFYQPGDRILGAPRYSGGAAITVRLGRGSATIDMSYMDKIRDYDYIGLYRALYGGNPDVGAAEYISEHGAIYHWNLRGEQNLTDRLAVFFRVDNLANDQFTAQSNFYVAQGRTSGLGVRFRY